MVRKQVRVEWDRFEAMVDKGIAPLILELWKARIPTINSCEENQPGRMWIQFASAGAAEAFVNIASQYEKGAADLYSHTLQCWDPQEGAFQGAWEYSIYPIDCEVKKIRSDESGTVPSIFFFIALDSVSGQRLPDDSSTNEGPQQDSGGDDPIFSFATDEA